MRNIRDIIQEEIAIFNENILSYDWHNLNPNSRYHISKTVHKSTIKVLYIIIYKPEYDNIMLACYEIINRC